MEHQRYYPEGTSKDHDIYVGHPVTEFEYSDLMKPFGGVGLRVEDPAELKPALQKALAAVKGGKTALLNVMVSP